VNQNRTSWGDDYRPRVRRTAAVVAARERLAAIEPGGSSARPIDVRWASQVEPRALGMPCLTCDGPYRLDEHTAERIDGETLRVLALHCGYCGAPRTMYFRVAPGEN
jgi:hypothetical protein